MKAQKWIPALALCFLLTFVSFAALAEEPFSYADLSVGGIAAGATPEQVESALGAPLDRETLPPEAATGATIQTYRYAGLSLDFTDGTLTDATYTDATYAGPRGIHIGDAEDAVKAAFPYDAAMAQAHEGVLYAAGWVDALDMALPPCGSMTQQEDAYITYQYLSPVTPYSPDILNSPESFLFENHASLTVTLSSANRTVTGLIWRVCPLAE